MIFARAGEELSTETNEYLKKHKRLHYKMPYYTHAGELPASNVIHMTLSEDRQSITET